ncbi:MAG: 3-hydroxyacyl-CoA dehydrogenase [Variovorax sp.]|nr:MAG: 3-hydroxyacyl-CoA dehydrogenase [Variovorax sp.]
MNSAMTATHSPESEHLQRATQDAAHIPGLPAGLALRPLRTVGVVGAGTMGGGIAMNFANAGMPTVILETSQAALDRGFATIRRNYEATAAKGRITAQQVEERMALLTGTLDGAALTDRDLVIEAVFERMDVKREVMAMLGQRCKPGAIIATNTSTLDVDALAAATGRPADVLGMHFFSPANVMRLLEVVRGAATAPDVLATVMALAPAIGKVAVVSGVCYGFIGNRMLEPYLREADFLLMEGATPQQIDRAIEAQGLAMGPCRMLDMTGTDVAASVVIEGVKSGALPTDPSYRAPVRRLSELGRKGQKSGSGYYRYDGRKHLPDDAVTQLCRKLATAHGIAQRSDITDEEIVARCLYPLINEAASILQEGMAYRPGDIDVVWVNGYGFPAQRGGPVWMADAIGLTGIVTSLKAYGDARGNTHGYWNVSKLLERTAAGGSRLSDAGA